MTTHSKHEVIARVCHEANRAYCSITGEEQLPWEQAPIWQKEAARAGVEHILNNHGLSPRDIFELWKEKKLEDGWKYGNARDEEKKEHPCLVQYENLPLAERKKDELFKAIVLALSDICNI